MRFITNQSTYQFQALAILTLALVGCSTTNTPEVIPSEMPATATAVEPTLTPTTAAFEAGATQNWEADGMAGIYIPAGEFTMGSDQNFPNEKPVHAVSLNAYWIDQTHITNAMFQSFVDNTDYETHAERTGSSNVYIGNNWEKTQGADWAHPAGPDSDLSGLENYPVVHISWADAEAYCQWAGRQLPTEAQWEKAARGTDERIFPWGVENDTSKANYDNSVGAVVAVGSYPAGASPYGVLDMTGNVWDFTADWFSANYYQNSPPENPTGPTSGSYRVVRGGSWGGPQEYVNTTYRGQHPPTEPFDHVSFRCVAPAE